MPDAAYLYRDGPRVMTVSDLLRILAARKWIIAGVTFASLVLCGLYLTVATPRYTVSMLVAPVTADDDQLAQYRGAAALIGMRLPTTEAAETLDRYIVRLSSIALARRLMERHPNVVHIVESDTPVTAPQQLAGLLRELISTDTLDGGIRRVYLLHADPDAGVQLMSMLHQAIDGMLREEALERTETYLEYLDRQMRDLMLAEQRNTVVDLYAGQLRERMLAQVELPFAVRIFDPPTASLKPTSPKPVLYLAAAFVLGVMLGTGAALIAYLWRR